MSSPTPIVSRFLPPILLALVLTGCEQLGLDDGAKAAAQREADGKAIGSACRQSGRALEDCYTLYAKASKAAIFAGWQNMDGYMRDNNISEVIPDTVEPPGGKKPAATAEAKPAPAEEAAPAPEAPAEGKPAGKGPAAKTGASAAPQGRPRRVT